MVDQPVAKTSLGADTIAYPLPVWVVGTYDAEGRANALTAAWVGVCCSDPPCVAVSVRKSRYSFAALLARRAFTVNVPSERYVREVDYLGLASGRNADKLAAMHLTPVRSELVDAPYIAEFPLVIECRLLQAIDLGVHTQFVGQIVDVKADPAVLDEQGLPDMERIRPIVFATKTYKYHGIGPAIASAFSVGKGAAK
jgi:flavin reductase (DIM6/NTAB) family NADH-FMN oxidoreductase RutF